MEESYLHKMLKNIIRDLCDEVGCANCPEKWEGGCVATDIQDNIFKMEEKLKDIK